MPRVWIWLQLVIGWIPVWALYATLILASHRGTSWVSAALIAGRATAAAAVLAIGVQRLTVRLPWPHPFRLAFLASHFALAVLFSALWLGATLGIELVLFGHASPGLRNYPYLGFMVIGIWLYVMVAGVSYAQRATERAARAEALAARSRLAALRAQLNPHFLFNALHTVVQLIPTRPREATQTAEELAGLLRTTIEEDRDQVTLGEELAFVERYLALERVRYGDRLEVRVDVPESARDSLVPSFALQTLVENAVRHGLAPRVEPTAITIEARAEPDGLSLSVKDNGAGADASRLPGGDGTGLRRLREQLVALHGPQARLDVSSTPGAGFTAALFVPRGASS